MAEQEQTASEVHENIIETVRQAILRRINVTAIANHKYAIEEGDFFEIDLIALIDNKLCIFEIKTGKKLKKAIKQLKMHKSCMTYLQNEMNAQGLFFSEVKTFWVSWKEEKVVNTSTNREIHIAEFLENPLPFLLQ